MPPTTKVIIKQLNSIIRVLGLWYASKAKTAKYIIGCKIEKINLMYRKNVLNRIFSFKIWLF